MADKSSVQVQPGKEIPELPAGHFYPGSPSTPSSSTPASLLNHLQKFFPVLPLWVAIVLAILNVYIPGSGTFISALLVCCPCCSHFTVDETNIKTKSFFANFFFGLLQFALAGLFLIGWVWSVVWGFLFLVQACTHLIEYPPERGIHRSLLPFVPGMSLAPAIILLTINCLLPGLGTILSGLCCACMCLPPAPGVASEGNASSSKSAAGNREDDAEGASFYLLARGSRCGTLAVTFLFGLLQMLLTVVVVGWFWSIYWGTLFVSVNLSRRELVEKSRLPL